MKKTIIVWDRDIVWVEDLKKSLRKRGYFCEEIDDREEYFQSIGSVVNPALCVLSKGTLDECSCSLKEIMTGQKENRALPVVLVSETDEVEVELEALRAGAAEVLFKSRTTEVALERMMSLLDGRRLQESYLEEVRFGEDYQKEIFFRENFEGIHFSFLEQNVLYALRDGEIVDREELIGKYWPDRVKKDKNNRVVDTVIKQLRKKIQNTVYEIEGIYGRGYQLKKKTQDE